MNPSDVGAGSDIGLSWRMREHEARLLADSLRTSRLTLLYAGAGASRTALLREGVASLIARRESDAAVDDFLDSRVVEPFVDRREAQDGHDRIERVVFFDGWEAPEPLDALSTAVWAVFPGETPGGRRPLADVLSALAERHHARLLLVFDAVERLWVSESNHDATHRFIDGVADAVNRPGLRANFLLAVDDRFDGRLDAMRARIPRFDDSTVRLMGFDEAVPAKPVVRPPAPSAAEPPTLSDAVTLPAAVPVNALPEPAHRTRRKRPPKLPVPPPVPIKADAVYAFIESRLSETAMPSRPWEDDEEAPARVRTGPRGRRRSVPDFEPTRPMRYPASVAPVTEPPSGKRDPNEGGLGVDAWTAPVSARSLPRSWLGTVVAWCRRRFWRG